MHKFFETLNEYRTEVAGPWQTRDCSAWEYDTKAQELIQMADNLPPYHTTEEAWLRPQAKILQNRADYIRQSWARKEARKQADERFNQLLADIQATLQAMQQTTQQITQLATQQLTPPAPQEARKEEDKQPLQQAIVEENAEITAEKQAPLYQATVEDITESITESTTKDGNSMAVSKSTLSTFPRLCTTPTSRDLAACLSNALLFAFQHTGFLNTTIPGYIEYSEDMEATGQG